MALSAAELEDFRLRLEAEWQQLGVDAVQAHPSAEIVELDQSSVGRLSRMDALQQQALAIDLQQRLATRVRKLRAALDRLGAETYGLCCECDAPLDLARLTADPAAVFCADCLSERENS